MYVSHRLPEVLTVAHRITVLRDGVSQGTYDAATTSEADVVALMIGRPLELAFPASSRRAELRGGAGGRPTCAAGASAPSNLTLTHGEIVGIAGAEGNGQVQLLPRARRRRGVERIGSLWAQASRPAAAHPGRCGRASCCSAPNRKEESIFTALGVRANATLQVLKRFRGSASCGGAESGRRSTTLVDRLRLKAASIEQPAQYLSGGNQQKVALMRPFMQR